MGDTMSAYPKNPRAVVAGIWRSLGGLFGADAVARKFGEQPPDEWVFLIGDLPEFKITRGMRRLAHSGAKYVPTLPEFLRLCNTVGDEPGDSPPALPAPQEIQKLGWLGAANRHLIAHIMKVCMTKPTRYGPVNPREYDAHRNVKPLNTHPLAQEATAWLVEARDAWVADMQDIQDAKGEVPVDVQKKIWRDWIDAVEKRIDQRPWNLAEPPPAGYAAGRGIYIGGRPIT